MNRLHNALAQRNAAREEALMVGAKLKQMQEELESGHLVPAGAAAAAAAGAAAAAVTPTGAEGPAEEGTTLDRMRRYMQTFPGFSPSKEGAVPSTPPVASSSGAAACLRRQRCCLCARGCARCPCTHNPCALGRPARRGGPALRGGPPPARAVQQAAAAAA